MHNLGTTVQLIRTCHFPWGSYCIIMENPCVLISLPFFTIRSLISCQNGDRIFIWQIVWGGGRVNHSIIGMVQTILSSHSHYVLLQVQTTYVAQGGGRLEFCPIFHLRQKYSFKQTPVSPQNPTILFCLHPPPVLCCLPLFLSEIMSHLLYCCLLKERIIVSERGGVSFKLFFKEQQFPSSHL